MQGIFSDDENLGHPRKYFAKKNTAKLFITSIIEGFVFVFLAYLFSLFINNKWILVFVLGSVIHIMSEWIGIHKAFCLEDCGLLNT
jgi:hypothetical protein